MRLILGDDDRSSETNCNGTERNVPHLARIVCQANEEHLVIGRPAQIINVLHVGTAQIGFWCPSLGEGCTRR